MFDHIGTKIKSLAKVFFVVLCLSAVLVAIIMTQYWEYLALLLIPIGVIVAWLSTFLLYAFGQLVENSDIQTEIMAQEALRKQNEIDKESSSSK